MSARVYTAKGVRVVINGVEHDGAAFDQMLGRTKRPAQSTTLAVRTPRPSWFVRLLLALGWMS